MEAYLEAPEGLLQRQVWEWVFSLLAPASDPSFTDPMGTPPTLPDPMSPDGIYGGMKVPEGVGLPRDVYVAALKSLGFGVDVRVKLDFNRDHDPDDVLHVDPAPGPARQRTPPSKW